MYKVISKSCGMVVPFDTIESARDFLRSEECPFDAHIQYTAKAIALENEYREAPAPIRKYSGKGTINCTFFDRLSAYPVFVNGDYPYKDALRKYRGKETIYYAPASLGAHSERVPVPVDLARRNGIR